MGELPPQADPLREEFEKLLEGARRKRRRNHWYQDAVRNSKNILGEQGDIGRTIQDNPVIVFFEGLEQQSKVTAPLLHSVEQEVEFPIG